MTSGGMYVRTLVSNLPKRITKRYTFYVIYEMPFKCMSVLSVSSCFPHDNSLTFQKNMKFQDSRT